LQGVHRQRIAQHAAFAARRQIKGARQPQEHGEMRRDAGRRKPASIAATSGVSHSRVIGTPAGAFVSTKKLQR
jgi:hypothetical protein